MKRDLQDIISEYFSENAPPMVNFLSYIQKNHMHDCYSNILFYFMPTSYTTGFPFRIFYFHNGKNVTDLILQKKTYSAMDGIFRRLPEIIDEETRESLPEVLNDGTETLGIEGFFHKHCTIELQRLVNHFGIKQPSLESQIHDSSHKTILN